MADETQHLSDSDPAGSVIEPVSLDNATYAPPGVPVAERPKEPNATDIGHGTSVDFKPHPSAFTVEWWKILLGIDTGIRNARIVFLILSVRGQITAIISNIQQGNPMTLEQFKLYITPIATVIATILALFHVLPGVTADNIIQVLTGIWSIYAAVQTVWLTVAHLINAQHIAATPNSPTNAAAAVIASTPKN